LKIRNFHEIFGIQGNFSNFTFKFKLSFSENIVFWIIVFLIMQTIDNRLAISMAHLRTFTNILCFANFY